MTEDALIARVVAGRTPLRLSGEAFFTRHPSRLERVFAEDIYADALARARDEGLYSPDDLLTFLADRQVFTAADEDTLLGISKDIDTLKVGLFEQAFRSDERKRIRKTLASAKAKQGELLARRHSYDHLGCEGFASSVKLRYLVGVSLRDRKGRRVWRDEAFWEAPCGRLDLAVEAYLRARPDDGSLRSLSRSPAWATIWACCRGADPFGKAPVDYTEEQRSLVNWSRLYDDVRDHPEAPHPDVVADDDALDGWLIVQKRKREAEVGQKGANAITNEKIRNSAEVFVMTGDAPEDIARVEAMNDPAAKRVKAQRMAHLAKKGEVHEADMPDSRQKILMMMNNAGAK
jgi:hypothetical protein